MKTSIKFLIYFAVILMILLLAGFSGFVCFSDVKFNFKVGAIVFSVVMTLICATFFLLISNHVSLTLKELSKTIQSMIDDNPKNTFSELDDTMLSKLQSQVIKLSDILKSHTIRYKKEKENLTELISDISHQLKTPLANLNMYNFLLLDGNIDKDKRVEFTQNMQSQIDKLNWLMESLIKMSRLETGIINLIKAKSSIMQTVLQSISMVSLKAEQKNIDITFDGDENITINHDIKWTQEAIFNILDNAIKYSPANTVVDVVITKYELFCRIDVRDNGMGITEADINKIFMRFYRGENGKNIDGVGIGLFLSRKIISEQGGYIKVKSVVGKGSMFSIFLPLSIIK